MHKAHLHKCCEQEAIPPGRPSEALLTNGLIGAPVAQRVADARGSSLVGILVENAVESTVAAAEQRSRGAGRQEEPEMVKTELKFTAGAVSEGTQCPGPLQQLVPLIQTSPHRRQPVDGDRV